MLSSEHVKVAAYYNDSATVFPNTNINGGVVVVYQDKNSKYPPISDFIPDNNLRKIAERFRKDESKTCLPSCLADVRILNLMIDFRRIS